MTHGAEVVVGQPLARCEVRAMSEYAAVGDMHQAANNLGLSFFTLRNQLHVARAKLGVTSSIDAFRALGWLRVPLPLTFEVPPMVDWSSTSPVITHCPHGLDMRLHPRCYLCTPVPEMRVITPPSPVPLCTCPSVWYGTMRPPCPVHNPTFGNSVVYTYIRPPSGP